MSRSARSDLHEVDVIYIHATERAVLVSAYEGGEEVWLPLAQVEIAPSGNGGLRRGRPARLTGPEGLLQEKGLL